VPPACDTDRPGNSGEEGSELERGLGVRAGYLLGVDVDGKAEVMDMRRALAAAAATSEPEMRRAYRRAVTQGTNNSGCTPDRERAYGALRLLTLATLRLPDLVLYAHLAELYGDETDAGCVPRLVVSAVSDVAAGALRLTHRALEVHGHSLHYAIAAWTDRALERAGSELNQPARDRECEVLVAVDQARLATIALTRATAATATDPMLVPAEAANGLGHLLAVYLIAIAAAT